MAVISGRQKMEDWEMTANEGNSLWTNLLITSLFLKEEKL